MRRSRLRRAVKLTLVASRELVAAASDAFEAISAEMDAYDAGVDASSIRQEDLPSSRAPAAREPTGGPFGRTGPMDDSQPTFM